MYVLITQDGIGRISAKNTHASIDGLYTEGMQSCITIILHGKKGSDERISLIHNTGRIDKKIIKREQKWVGEVKAIALFYNPDREYDPRSFSIPDYMDEIGLPGSTPVHATRAGAIFVHRNNTMIPQTLPRRALLLPNELIKRHLINILNNLNQMHEKRVGGDLQFDGEGFTPCATLLPSYDFLKSTTLTEFNLSYANKMIADGLHPYFLQMIREFLSLEISQQQLEQSYFPKFFPLIPEKDKMDVYLIGERHDELGKKNRSRFIELCEQNRVLCAAEGVRLCSSYNAYANEIGDYIAQVYSAVSLMVIDLNHGVNISETCNMPYFENHAHFLKEGLVDSLEPLLKKRYGDSFSLETLSHYIRNADAHMTKESLLQLLVYLNGLLKQSTYINNKDLEALDLTFFERNLTGKEKELIKKQVLHDLRDPGFIEDIKEIMALGQKNFKAQLFIIVGRAHLKHLREVLSRQSDALNIDIQVFWNYPKIDGFDSEREVFIVSPNDLEQKAIDAAKVLQKYYRNGFFNKASQLTEQALAPKPNEAEVRSFT